MPIAHIDLTKRSETGAALTQTQFDGNYTLIETKINALIDLIQIALKDDGDLKDGTLKAIAQITDNLLTLAKFAALTGDDKGAFIRSNKTSGSLEAVHLTSNKITDSTAVHSTAAATGLSVSTFTFTDLPAGDVMVWLDLSAIRNAGSNGGTLSLLNGSTVIAAKPTHVVDLGAGSQWVPISMFGRIANFAGGDLELELQFETSEASSDITFGVDGEDRFARNAMVLAGL
jgi:hypothetical protein